VSWGVWLLVIYVALLVWALRKPKVQFEGPWWFHLRAFLPNWKFYHAPGWMPRLMIRQRSSALKPPEPWELVYPRHRFRWTHLLHNPEVNLALAWQNLVDHLANDIHSLPDEARIEDQAIYQLVQDLAAHSSRSRPVTPGQQFQFALHLVHATRQQTEVVLTSPWTDLQPACDSVEQTTS
jgi:hypothetical protein